MKNKWKLFVSRFQIVSGILAILSFMILALNGENMTRWIITLLLAIAFIIMGIIGIKDYRL